MARGQLSTTTTCVAGVQTPAFVERSTAPAVFLAGANLDGVAGVQTPAFVERGRNAEHRRAATEPRVAGVQTPAFVERGPELGRSAG